MGMGNISKGQYIKGLLFLVIEAAYAMFLIFFGIDQLSQFGTLGTQEGGLGVDPTTGAYGYVEGDNSMLILLYGVTTIVVSVVFLVFYIMNTKSAMKVQELKAEGKRIPTFKEELKQFGEGTAGGGAVTATANGKKEILSLKISPAFFELA